MRLTRKKAKEFCIRMWTRFARTGETKADYKYTKEELKYCLSDRPNNDCWFCEYDTQHKKVCRSCPLGGGPNRCLDEDMYYEQWEDAKSPRTRKKYAKLFLEQIKSLK